MLLTGHSQLKAVAPGCEEDREGRLSEDGITCGGTQSLRVTGGGDDTRVISCRGLCAGLCAGGGGRLQFRAGRLLRTCRGGDVVEGVEGVGVVPGLVPDEVAQLQTLAGVQLSVVTSVGHQEGLIVNSLHVSFPRLSSHLSDGSSASSLTSNVTGVSKVKVTLQPL